MLTRAGARIEVIYKLSNVSSCRMLQEGFGEAKQGFEEAKQGFEGSKVLFRPLFLPTKSLPDPCLSTGRR